MVKGTKTLLARREGKDYFFTYLVEDQDENSLYVRAYPIGGGHEFKIPRKDIVSMDAVVPRTIRKKKVGFDESQWGIYDAYVFDNNYWNGWLQPFLEREAVKQFVDEQNKLDEDYTDLAYRFENNVLYINYKEYDQSEEIEATTIEYEDKEIKVWDVSLGLCWIEWTDEELENEGGEDV